MDIENIQMFLRVVERGSFTAAADYLNVTVAKVSRKVKQLEEALGVQLLYRTTRRVAVTEAGLEYYERCLLAESILDEANQKIRALRTEPAGTIRLLAPYAVGLISLEPKLVEFRRRFPNVRLSIVYDNRPLDLTEHGFDLAIRVGPIADSEYAIRSLGWSRARLVASPVYLEKRAEPTAPEQLEEHEALTTDYNSSVSTWRLRDPAGAIAKVNINPVVIANESVTLIRQAIHGAGIALVSTQFVTSHVKHGELQILLPHWYRADDAELCALFPRRATLDSKVRAFLDFLVEAFADWRI